MKTTLCVLLSGLFVLGAVADEPPADKGDSPDGRKILEKAAAAIKKVDVAGYHADYKATGWAVPLVPTVQGEVVIGPQSKWEINRFRCQVKAQLPGSSDAEELTAGSDGDLYFMIDSKAKIAYEDMDPAVLGKHERTFPRVLMPGFGAAEPFKDELESDSIELKGTIKIGNEECYEIHVTRPSPPSLHWYLAKKDLLPRRLVRVYPNQQDPKGDDGTTQITISDLVVNPKYAVDPFKLHVPEGFTKTNEFAP